ncbi:N-acetylneuraminate synthase family protein [Adlercreutzia sp. ZJ138]|uniref:N-acetylneuraminate synthase family protein n=1 Tax=Adlercreutzia sp. ZJ138 TaxID=2709405 RepID=UPI0013ECCD38|nr:N-acetylneuraminate synthase family protein [Adlercreutzia sp. ZJ138]
MRTFFEIGDVPVTDVGDVLVIPEVGINHNGCLAVAKEMVDAAYRAGAKLVKHQTHVVDDEMSAAARKVKPGNADMSIYDIMSACALSEEDEYELMVYVESLGMEFLSTPFSRAAADRLEHFGIKAYKVGSGEMNNLPLLAHIASFGKPMIVSTGMNGLKRVCKAVKVLEDYKVPFALLHTTNLYPTDPSLVRLGAMQEMMGVFPGVPVGLSDHTLTNAACTAAIALGARIVERHFTDRMDREGPDIVCSMDETALGELLAAAHDVPLMLGGCKDEIANEQVTRDFAFASVVAIKGIMAGERLTVNNIWVKRPGTGDIPAEYYDEVLGKTAGRDIVEGEQIAWDILEG